MSEESRAQDRAWREYVAALGSGPTEPFNRQLTTFAEIFRHRSDADGPPPVWEPTHEVVTSNVGRFMRAHGFDTFDTAHRWSVEHREAFWTDVANTLGVVFRRPAQRVLGLTHGVKDPAWFEGAELNIVDSCFSAPRDQPAVLCASEESSGVTVTSYGELEQLVNAIACGLRQRRLQPGDVLALYMPMTLECVATYLAAVRSGLCVASVADSFSPAELAKRCDIVDAQCVVTVDSYQRGGRRIRLYDKVKEAKISTAIVVQNVPPEQTLRAGDISFDELRSVGDQFEAIAVAPDTVINVLFSSGTTGTPKAIPWTQLTPLKSAMDGHFHQDIQSTDVVAWPTNIGWMMGPWLIFATLMNRACMALFAGAPNGERFTQFVSDAKVTVLGVIPSLVRSWRSSEAVPDDRWSNLRVFSSTGEQSSREDYLWLMSRTRYRTPVIEYLGGTEIGGGHLTGTVVQPASPTVFTTAALGLNVLILDEAGHPLRPGQSGELFLVPPSIGLSQRLLNGDHDAVYYTGCPQGPAGEVLRRHGDHIRWLPGGGYRAQGRVDDTMNLGGIKVSAAELERVIETHDAVYEAAAVGVPVGEDGVTQLIVFVVLAESIDRDVLLTDLQSQLSRELNPLFRLADVIIVDALPRTASNKIQRRHLRAAYLDDR